MNTAKIISLTLILLTTSINLFSQTADEWKKLGNTAMDSADYDKAIEYYQKAIETDSTYFDAHYNLGGAFARKHEFEKAIEAYQKAMTIDDTDADCYFALGTVYSNLKEYRKAIDFFKQGLELKPDSPYEYSFLGYLYQENGQYIYSIFYAKKAAQLGDTLVQQDLRAHGISWEEDHFVKPDYAQIKSNIEDKQSNLHYAKLWDKYQNGDSTMTLEEKRHLYYGYVFNKNYSPYGSSSGNHEKINTILDKKNPTQKEWKKLVSLLNSALKEEPFHIRYLFYQRLAYISLDKEIEAEQNRHKIWCISDALNSTGHGLTKEGAVHVIAVPSEYDYLFLNNVSMKSQALVKGGYDVLYLHPNEEGLEEMWFDVSQSLNHLLKFYE
ncbi:DUF4919 domain-containing protein [Porphyromonadaceae bacterium OttesenSCG-928-L07]|nr:DUF4919 domain-containing protein [Porphyromonadaceae bacterium OttesenSCG-928-L07]